MRRFIVKNLKKSIENLNKRIDELEAGDLDILKELLSALEFLLEEVGDPTPAIDKYNEIVSFLDLIENTSKLKSLLDDIRNSIPEAPVQSDWAKDDVNDQAYIKNKPNLSTVATSGSYNDLSDKPDLANVATSGSYEDLSNKPHIPEDPVLSDWAENDTTDQAYIKNKPNLASVATSGDYTDLSNKPTIPAALIQSDWAQDDNTLVDYIKNKPTIPAEQIQSDWNQSDTAAKDYIKNKPNLATVATTGDYNDLNNKPDLSTVATTGSYNDLTDKPTIPTKVSDLTNNSDFLKNPHLSNGHEYVEIAGMKWATMNIGATSTTDKGLFFAWGETVGYPYNTNSDAKSFSLSDYKYAEFDGSDYIYTKYNDTDQKTQLDLEDDPARVNWGGNWRMPTHSEFLALTNACTVKLVHDNGVVSTDMQPSGVHVVGFLFIDKTDYTKTIYFPYCLFEKDGHGPISQDDGSNMFTIWLNNVSTETHKASNTVGTLTYTNGNWDGYIGAGSRPDFVYAGRAVRPILDEQSTPSTVAEVAITGDYNDLVNKPIIRVVNLTQNLANETSTISGVENSGKTEVVIYNNTTDESHFVMVSTINKTPTGKLLELIAPVGGYCEVSYINIDGIVFAKGLIVKNDDDNDSLYDNDGDWIVAEFDVDDATTATKIYGGLYSYAYLYGFARLGAIVIDDVTVISKSQRNGPYNGYDRSFVYKFNSEGIHKVKYEVTPGEAGGLFRGCTKLIRINLPSSETLIGREYFSGCTNLKRINSDTDGVFNIPNGVTYIGKDCFNGCNSLTTINIPESVSKISDYYIEMSSNGTHGGSVFLNCENLTTINVDSNNTIYDSRNNCNAIIKTENNTLVLGCKNTTIPSTAINIGVGAFSGCKGMTSLTIPNNIVTINDRAFEYCDLQEINIPTSVKYIGESVFEGCSSLKRINSNTDGVFNVLSLPVTIGGVFSSASHVFLGCSLLDTLNISSTATEEISTSDNSYNTNILERTTSDCQGTFSKFNHITVDQNNSVYDSRNNCDAIIRTTDNSLVVGCKNTVIPSTVTSIEYRAFNGCPVETITIPGTVTTIKAVAFDGASLRSVTIQEGTTTIEGGAFNKCNYLNTMSISSTVTSIGPSGLQNLSTITVDPNNTVYDSRDNCNAIIETSTNKLIMGASGTVVVPQTVTEIGTSAFAQRQISSITLPNSIVTIGGSAFTSGSGYESRVYRINSDENGVYNLPTGLKTIGNGAFYGQKSLIELNLPEGITSLGTGCFESCSSLKRVNSDVDGIANIPESVTSLDIHIFRFCDGISKIIFSSIVPPTMSSWTTLDHQTIYVPTESLEAYKTAAGARAGYIHPISELED